MEGGRMYRSCEDLERLTGEIIGNDPANNNGSIVYTYDPVGNRQLRSSGITQIPTQNLTGQYDSNDRLTASGYSYRDRRSSKTFSSRRQVPIEVY